MAKKKVSKSRSLFFRDKEVVASKKKLNTLKKKRKELKNDIANIAAIYNKTVESISTGKYDSFPLETIYDMVSFERGHKNDFKLSMLKLRNDLKEKYLQAGEEIEKLDLEIRESEIDCLLAKANCMNRKMDN